MNLNTITEYINGNAATIVANQEHESIEVYRYLTQKFSCTNVTKDLTFQFLYRSFYRLDNAGLTSDFKLAYFAILEENRTNIRPDLKAILEKLRSFKNKKNQENLQFSFATKLANTINNSYPIYDSEVASVFGYRRPTIQDFDQKVNAYLTQYDSIGNTYSQILSEDLLNPALMLFDAKFQGHNLSEMKRLDFIFWSAGKLLKKEKKTIRKTKQTAKVEASII